MSCFKAKSLAGFNLFQQLDERQTDQLSRWTKTVKYRKGEFVFMPGDPSQLVYFVHDGCVKFSYLDDSGKHLTLAFCRVGESFGEMSLLGELRQRLIAEAQEDVELCVISSRHLIRFAFEHPEFLQHLTRAVGARMRKLEERFEDLVFKNVPTRLARTLLWLKQDFGADAGGGNTLEIKLTHRDLADLIGSTRETTTLTLSQFADLGLVGKVEGYYQLLDEVHLRRIAKLYDHRDYPQQAEHRR